MKQCIICGSNRSKIIFRESAADILVCLDCGHIFSAYMACSDYDGYFDREIREEDKFWWQKAHQKMYNEFIKRFLTSSQGRLLDVGCGLGYFVKQVSANTNWQVFGSEISPVAVKFAQEELGLKNILCGTLEDINFPSRSIDVITLWDVIEHIPNPLSLLRRLKTILTDDGFVFLHTPNVKVQLFKARIKKILRGGAADGNYMEAKDHLNIYSPQTIKKILNLAGFNQVIFTHLPPIQSVSGSQSKILKRLKNLWFYFAKFVFFVTRGSINLDNLFIIAKK